tara:strand:+ start:7498 stop:7692 length:195 start_codon:yes stop_codon:yes gene_type:complete
MNSPYERCRRCYKPFPYAEIYMQGLLCDKCKDIGMEVLATAAPAAIETNPTLTLWEKIKEKIGL